MKNNEEKLLQLLQIAVENGWKPYGYFIDLFEINHFQCKLKIAVIEDNIVYFRPVWNISFDEMSISLNDLISNWEKGKISFIEALCNADGQIAEYASDNDFYLTYLDLHINIIKDWSCVPTPKRFNWLFETFSHLLTKN